MRFQLGRLVATRSVANVMAVNAEFAAFVSDSLKRYVTCDWGTLDQEDHQRNDRAVKDGDERILAAYPFAHENLFVFIKFKELFPLDDKIWIITEHDRSATTILLPSEY